MLNRALNKHDRNFFVKWYKTSEVDADFKEAEITVKFPWRKKQIIIRPQDGLKKTDRELAINKKINEEEKIYDAMMMAQHKKSVADKPKFKAKVKFSFAMLKLVLFYSMVVFATMFAGPNSFNNSEVLMALYNFINANLLAITIGAGLATAACIPSIIRNSLILIDIEDTQFVVENKKTLNLVREDPKYCFGMSIALEEQINNVPLDKDPFTINNIDHSQIEELKRLSVQIKAMQKAKEAAANGQQLEGIFESLNGKEQPLVKQLVSKLFIIETRETINNEKNNPGK